MILNIILTITLWNLFASLLFKKQNSLLCGIVGFCGKENANIDLLKIIFLFNIERGEDAAGMYHNGFIKRQIGKLSDGLLISEPIQETKLFIGHTRKASFGTQKSLDNVHPFNYGSIVGAHNGTLTNTSALEDKYKFVTNLDSQLIFKRISQDKLDVLTDLNGAAAILYYDSNKKQMFAYRNKERPLFRGKRPEGLYISSMKNSLECIGCGSIKEFSEDYLYGISDGEIVSTTKIKRDPIFKIYNRSNTQSSTIDHNGQYNLYEYEQTKEPDYEFGYFWYTAPNGSKFRISRENTNKQVVFDYVNIKSSQTNSKGVIKLPSVIGSSVTNKFKRLLRETGVTLTSYSNTIKLLKELHGVKNMAETFLETKSALSTNIWFDENNQVLYFYNFTLPADLAQLTLIVNNQNAVGYWDIENQKGFCCNSLNHWKPEESSPFIENEQNEKSLIYDSEPSDPETIKAVISQKLRSADKIYNGYLTNSMEGFSLVSGQYDAFQDDKTEIQALLLQISDDISSIKTQLTNHPELIKDDTDRTDFLLELSAYESKATKLYNDFERTI